MIVSRSLLRFATRRFNRIFGLLTSVVAALGVSTELAQVSHAQTTRNTINAVSCSPADVSNAVNAARAGDIVQVPAGTCIWPTSVGLSKNIWLKGAGPGATVFKNNGSWEQYYSKFMLYWNGPFEMSGITFDGNNAIGALSVAGTGTDLKIHDNVFTHARSRAFNGQGLIYGVVYQNTFVDNFIDVDSGGVEQAGWDAPFNYGDGNNLFVEDNVINHQSDTYRGQVYYTSYGGRMVFRHNAMTGFIDYDMLDNHGNMGPDPRTRGFVGGEIYENTFTLSSGTYSSWRWIFHRGGQLMMFNNTVTAPSGWAGIELSEEDAWKTALGCPCPIRDNVANSHFWNNTFNGAAVSPTYNHPPEDPTVIIKGSNYWEPLSGLDASRPAACAPNTFFGASDSDKLYRCGLTGTWQPLYQAYTYPHPLRDSAMVGTPAAPRNLRVVR